MNRCEEGNVSVALGRQMAVEYYDCDPHVLADASGLEKIFLRAAEAAHATVVESCFHAFAPQGVSGVVVISESHLAVHAWPEHDYAAVDIFTCGDKIDFDAAAECLHRELHSKQMVVSCVMNRGIVNRHGVERPVEVCAAGNPGCSLSWKERFEQSGASGISLALDLYDCRKISPEDFAGLAEVFSGFAGKNPAGGFSFRKDCSGNGVFGQDWDAGWIRGYWSAASGTVYLNLTAPSGFFEPRQTAERMLEILGGRYYRMQVAVRQ